MVVGYTTKLLLCVLLLYCCAVVTDGHALFDCCKAVSGKQIRKHRVRDYRHQVAGQGCDIDATIFVTRRNVKLCAPRSLPWVHELMKHVDDLKGKCMNNNYKGQRCQGLKPN